MGDHRQAWESLPVKSPLDSNKVASLFQDTPSLLFQWASLVLHHTGSPHISVVKIWYSLLIFNARPPSKPKVLPSVPGSPWVITGGSIPPTSSKTESCIYESFMAGLLSFRLFFLFSCMQHTKTEANKTAAIKVPFFIFAAIGHLFILVSYILYPISLDLLIISCCGTSP